MKKKELENLVKFVKKVGSFKPAKVRKKPDKLPSERKMKQAYKFDIISGTIKEVK